MSYMIITPVRNEEKSLPSLINSVLNQTFLPFIWVLVDNGSSDLTPEILKNLENDHEFVHIIKNEYLNDAKGHFNFSKSVMKGYEHGLLIANSNDYNLEYIAKIDADIFLPRNYFEKLIKECNNNPKIGIASGKMYNLEYEKFNGLKEDERFVLADEIPAYYGDEIPDERIYRQNFLNEVGGFPISLYSPDTILLAKARINGWIIKDFEELIFYHIIESTEVRKLWEKSEITGESKYYLNYHPLLLIGSALYMLPKKPFYPAIAMIYGYIKSHITKKAKISDPRLREYYWKTRMKEVLSIF